MYEVGEYIIHQNQNIYQVIKKTTSNTQQLYTLENSFDNIHVLAKEKDMIRKLLNKEELEEVIERIPFIRTLAIESETYRKDIYQESLNTYDEIEWIKIIKSVYIRQRRNVAHSYELEFYQKAKQLFHQEVAIVLNKEIAEVEAYITNMVEAR